MVLLSIIRCLLLLFATEGLTRTRLAWLLGSDDDLRDVHLAQTAALAPSAWPRRTSATAGIPSIRGICPWGILLDNGHPELV